MSLLDTPDRDGDYLLGIAAQCGFKDVVNLLLSKGVNVNVRNVIFLFKKES